MPIPDQVLEEIQSKVDIVEVISAYVALKKAGRNYKGLCPFHGEKTPSFMVSADKQIYHCFGCGAGGNIFGFLMNHEKMEFPEAVRYLAERAGVELPSFSDRDRANTALASQLYAVNELACGYFQAALEKNEAAVSYLERRGIRADTAKTFRIGYAPMAWDGLLNFLGRREISPELAEKAGLVIMNERGKRFDRFRERVIFPIFDVRNRIIGFGGRVLDSGVPKYMNSPETLVYSKGRHLYGLAASREEIKTKDFAIIVEGYLDLIVPFQAGIRNIVATCGTALTGEQTRLLKRYTNTCVMLYDPDEAGEAASLRNLDVFLAGGMNVYVATLKTGYDPDSFIRNFGVEEFNAVLKSAKNLFDYKLGVLLTRHNPATMTGKVAIAGEMLQTIAKVDNAIAQSGLLAKLAQALAVDEKDLRVEMGKIRSDKAATPVTIVPSASRERSAYPAEEMLLGLMLDKKDYLSRARDMVKVEQFRGATAREVARALYEHDAEEKGITAGILLNRFRDDPEASALISEAVAKSDERIDKDKSFIDCVQMIQQESVNRERVRLQEAIQKAQISGDEALCRELVQQFSELVQPKRS